jgi:hypothetical protein
LIAWDGASPLFLRNDRVEILMFLLNVWDTWLLRQYIDPSSEFANFRPDPLPEVRNVDAEQQA